MSLLIKDQDNNELIWRIGDRRAPIKQESILGVKYIQADGPELEHIKDLFIPGYYNLHIHDMHPTIPIPHRSKVVRWYGDIAKTILSSIM